VGLGSVAAVRRAVLGLALAAGVLAGSASAWAGGQEEPPPGDTSQVGPTTPPPTNPPVTTTGTTVPPSTLVPTPSTLPPNCEPPPAPKVIFYGRLDAAAGGVGRFKVEAVRSDPDGVLAIGRPVDVQLDNDLRFLILGNHYLIGAEAGDPVGLRSKVHVPESLFGGDQVIGADDPTAECPAFVDPIIVRNGDGSSVDTGVLSGFFDDKRGIAFAFLKPIGVAIVFVLWLLALKWLLIGTWRWFKRQQVRRRQWRGGLPGGRARLTNPGR
jgi:hypothetical protein